MWHSATGWFLTVAEPSVEPTLRPGLSDRDVAPGVLGFIITFALVVAVIGLMIAMSRRVRRVNHAKGANHMVQATIRTGPAPLDSGEDLQENSSATQPGAGQPKAESSQLDPERP